MAIQIHDSGILFDDGAIAMHADCCCDEAVTCPCGSLSDWTLELSGVTPCCVLQVLGNSSESAKLQSASANPTVCFGDTSISGDTTTCPNWNAANTNCRVRTTTNPTWDAWWGDNPTCSGTKSASSATGGVLDIRLWYDNISTWYLSIQAQSSQFWTGRTILFEGSVENTSCPEELVIANDLTSCSDSIADICNNGNTAQIAGYGGTATLTRHGGSCP